MSVRADEPPRGANRAPSGEVESQAHRIDALLLDLGGVFIEVVGAECMLDWCPSLPDTETLWKRWLHSPAVRSYESGRATRAEFARGVVAEFALPVEPDAFLAEFAWWPRRLYEGARPLLESLRARYRLASLSNTNELHWERFEREWNLPAHFDANFPSYAVGRLKPDTDYFRHVLDALDVPGERALFIDDNALNVAAAASLGIVARRAVGPDGVRAALADLGLEC